MARMSVPTFKLVVRCDTCGQTEEEPHCTPPCPICGRDTCKEHRVSLGTYEAFWSKPKYERFFFLCMDCYEHAPETAWLRKPAPEGGKPNDPEP